MKNKLLAFLAIVWVGLAFGISDDLRGHLLLEQLFNDNTNDTSGRSRPSKITGTITYETQPGTQLKYANITNSLTTDLGWSTDGYGSYTISYWVGMPTYTGNIISKQSLNYFRNHDSSNNVSISQNNTFYTQSYAPYSVSSCIITGIMTIYTGCQYGEWIHVLITKSPTKTEIYYNGISSGIIPDNYTKLFRNISLMGGGTNPYSTKIAQFRIFDRAVTSGEIQDIYHDFSVAREIASTIPTNTNAPTIKVLSSINDSLVFSLNGTQSSTTPGVVVYEYSWDGTNYITVPLESFTLVEGQYRFSVNASTRPFGPTMLSVRMKNNTQTTLLGTFVFNHDEPLPIITIDQPSMIDEPSKTITATTDKGVLEMRIVTEEICRISDVFEPYTPITFAALQDVGKIICYRATHNNRTVYKLSNKITNIERPTEEADVGNIWKDAMSWRYSVNQKKGDSIFSVLNMLASSQGAVFVDINGDGLVDVLYNNSLQKAVLVNNGDLSFDLKYKCYYHQFAPTNGYYGDCAESK